ARGRAGARARRRPGRCHPCARDRSWLIHSRKQQAGADSFGPHQDLDPGRELARERDDDLLAAPVSADADSEAGALDGAAQFELNAHSPASFSLRPAIMVLAWLYMR